MVDFNMDCSQTENGWFEFKAAVDDWRPPAEKDLRQGVPCVGTVGGIPPYQSVNHMARCGHINVFKWEEANSCQINSFP